MIPVLGVPVLNRGDLLIEMLASVDEPVGRVYIVDNGAGVRDVGCPMAETVHVCDPGVNLGVAVSWNLVIRANLDAPWWFFVNNDIVFEPGALARLVEVMDHADGPLIGMVWGYGAMAINDAAIEAVGLFDENFTPAYYEDSDWQWRATLKDVPHVRIYSETVHVGGGENALKAAPELRPSSEAAKYRNRQRYIDKWGASVAGSEMYRTPFDADGDPADWVAPRLSRLREQRWQS